jgi:hypothetical protein
VLREAVFLVFFCPECGEREFGERRSMILRSIGTACA